MTDTDPYRPTVLKIVKWTLSGKYRSEKLIAAIPPGLVILLLPTRVRQKILFREQNADTYRIASEMPKNIQLNI